MVRTLTEQDYLQMSDQKLLAYWILISTDEQGRITNHEEVEKILASYVAYGRNDVAKILSTATFDVDEPHESIIINKDQAKAYLLGLQKNGDHRYFEVLFTKRGTNEDRKMTCRYNPPRVTEGRKLYDESQYNLTLVWDKDAPNKDLSIVEKGAIRSINLDGVKWLKINGQEYLIQ